MYRSLDAFLCLFGLVQFTPRRAIRCDLALLECTRRVRGAESRAEQQRVALLTTLSYPYPPPAAAPSCTYTRQEEPTWPWAPEASRPTVRWGAWSCVRRPGSQLLPMPCPCVTLAAGSTTRRFHEVFMQVIYVSLSLLVNFVLQQG